MSGPITTVSVIWVIYSFFIGIGVGGFLIATIYNAARNTQARINDLPKALKRRQYHVANHQ